MIIEGELEFDRLDDDGNVWAANVWPEGHTDSDPVVVVELMSILGDDWWAEHQNDPELKSSVVDGWVDKAKVGEHHPAELRGLVGKRVRITVEVLDD